jgi:hypothetical protein
VEIFNYDLVFFGTVPSTFVLGFAEGKMGQEQEADSKQDSYGFVFGYECVHNGCSLAKG